MHPGVMKDIMVSGPWRLVDGSVLGRGSVVARAQVYAETTPLSLAEIEALELSKAGKDEEVRTRYG
jgi:hypothetical protein